MEIHSTAVRKERLRKVIRSLSNDPPPPLPPAHASRAAIVTTVKGVEAASLCSWCHYHLRVGFVKIFLYFDDAAEASSFPSGVGGGAVVTAAVDENLRTAWRRLGPAAAEWLPFADDEVQPRQALNALHALDQCVADGTIAWLLHIDADELFYPGPCLHVHEHFAQLAALDVASLTYANLEALPECDHRPCTEAEAGAAKTVRLPYAQASLFKRNPRLATHAPPAFFQYYTNGKSVCRVAPRARPLSPAQGQLGTSKCIRRGERP